MSFPPVVARAVRIYVHIGRPKFFEVEIYGKLSDTSAWLPTDELAHITYVKDGSTYRLYVNGELDQTLVDTVDTAGGNDPMLYFGSDYLNDGFEGYVRSVCTHTGAMTDAQVVDAYSAEMARPALSLTSAEDVCLDNELGVTSPTLTASPLVSEFYEGWGPNWMQAAYFDVPNFQDKVVHQWMIEIFNPTCVHLETAELALVVLPQGVSFSEIATDGLILNLCSGSTGPLADCPRIAPNNAFVLCGEEETMGGFDHIVNSTACDQYAAVGFMAVGHTPDGYHAFGLMYRGMLVDVFGDDDQSREITRAFNVSGGSPYTESHGSAENHVLVRKPHVVKGNLDWAASAGTNATDGEWVVYSYLGLRDANGEIAVQSDMGSHNTTNNTCPIVSSGLQGALLCSFPYCFPLFLCAKNDESCKSATPTARVPAVPLRTRTPSLRMLIRWNHSRSRASTA